MTVALVFLGSVVHEGWIAWQGQRLAATVPMQEFAGLTNVWTEYEGLAAQSWLGGLGVRQLGRALTRQSLILAERVAENYRTPAPTVREAQWLAATHALERAVTVAPTDATLRSLLRYSQGHLYRINGEARQGRGQLTQAQREFTEAVTAFRLSYAWARSVYVPAPTPV